MSHRYVFWFILLCALVSCKNYDEVSNPNNAIDLNRFTNEIEVFKEIDTRATYNKNSFVFVGSSSIRMWNSLEEDMSPIPIINRGFGGSTIPELIHFLDDLVIKYQPKVVVIYSGENDMWMEEIDDKDTFHNFRVLIKKLLSKLPDSEFYYIAAKPNVARWSAWPEYQASNNAIAAYCEEKPYLHFLDVSQVMLNEDGSADSTIFIDDMLHMNEEGYRRWNKMIRPIMLEAYEKHKE